MGGVVNTPGDLAPDDPDDRAAMLADVDAYLFRLACRWRREWLTGPPGLPHPPFPIFRYAPVVPDDPAELDG